jgi:hypothetical protein
LTLILVVLAITSARRGLISPKKKGTGDAGALPSCLDRFSKRMSEMTDERGGFNGKQSARRLLGQ